MAENTKSETRPWPHKGERYEDFARRAPEVAAYDGFRHVVEDLGPGARWSKFGWARADAEEQKLDPRAKDKTEQAQALLHRMLVTNDAKQPDHGELTDDIYSIVTLIRDAAVDQAVAILADQAEHEPTRLEDVLEDMRKEAHPAQPPNGTAPHGYVKHRPAWLWVVSEPRRAARALIGGLFIGAGRAIAGERAAETRNHGASWAR